MNSRLKAGKVCPLHRRRDCCGRGPVKPRISKHPQRFGVTYMADGREVCTPAKLRERKDRLIQDHPMCAGCGERFTDYSEIELAHKVSKGANGGKRDDRWPNLCLMHKSENREQGSRTLDQYLAWRREKGLTTP